MMQIDVFAPRYDVAERYQIVVHAPPKRVCDAVRSLDLSRSPVARALLRLRGMPEKCLTLDGLLRTGFIILAEVPDKELVLGLVGRFWSLAGDLQSLDAVGFRSFDRSGYAKATWSFSLEPQEENLTRLITETRVVCLDSASRRMFRFYWLLIKPFSGLIRREALRAVKRAAEQASPPDAKVHSCVTS